MKRALLIGVADEVRKPHLQPGPSLAAMSGLLEDLGGWEITRLSGADASREQILAQLASLQTRTRAGDAVLFYFFGHGGLVRFTDCPGSLGGRPVFYLASVLPTREWQLLGVLDVELSIALAELDRICGNVSVILDCCHSAQTVRDHAIPSWPAPSWVVELDQRVDAGGREHLLALESHPTIVRLAGASSLREAYGRRLPSGNLGLLTEGFVAVLREAELAIERLTWDAIGHRVRAHAIVHRSSEEQWVTLAGPRQRLLFCTDEAPLPRTVGFVPGPGPDEGWLRAGALQGVKVGDTWSIAALTLDERRMPRNLARARVASVELNRARVEGPGVATLAAGSSASCLRPEAPAAITVEGPAHVHEAIEADPLLRAARAGEATLASVRVLEGRLELTRIAGSLTLAPLPLNDAGLGAMLETLEEWARADQLVRALETCPQAMSAPPLTLSWGWLEPARGRGDSGRRTCTSQPGCLHAGDRMWLEIRHRTRSSDPWFVSVIEIGVAGRLTLISAREPDGVELAPFERLDFGAGSGPRAGGRELVWPDDVPDDRPRPVTLLVLASQRPIELGHLVRVDPLSEWPGSRAPRAARTRSAAVSPRPPELARKWSFERIDYLLDPRPR